MDSKDIPVDIEKCVAQVSGRFDLVLIAAQRARELRRGAAKLVPGDNTVVVTALKEVQAGLIGEEYLAKIPRREKFER
jgi:DNA-directed RNA polymerase omega subunit